MKRFLMILALAAGGLLTSFTMTSTAEARPRYYGYRGVYTRPYNYGYRGYNRGYYNNYNRGYYNRGYYGPGYYGGGYYGGSGVYIGRGGVGVRW